MNNIPDLIWFEIVNYLDVSSRLQLARVSKRMHRLLQSPLSWQFVDFTNNRIRKLSRHKSTVKKLFGAHTKCIRLRFKTPTENRDSWTKLSEEIVFLMRVCRDLRRLSVSHDVVDVGRAGPSSSLAIEWGDWPSGLRELRLEAVPLVTSLRCYRHKEKFLTNLRQLSIIDCHWFTIDDFHFLAPNPNLTRLEIANCARLFDKSTETDSDNSTTNNIDNRFSIIDRYFPNLQSISIRLARISIGVIEFLENCTANRISIDINNEIDFSNEIWRLIINRNRFQSNRSALRSLSCNSHLIESIADCARLPRPGWIDRFDWLSAPFDLEIRCRDRDLVDRYRDMAAAVSMSPVLVCSAVLASAPSVASHQSLSRSRKRKHID